MVVVRGGWQLVCLRPVSLSRSGKPGLPRRSSELEISSQVPAVQGGSEPLSPSSASPLVALRPLPLAHTLAPSYPLAPKPSDIPPLDPVHRAVYTGSMPESPLVSVRLEPEIAALIEEVQQDLNLSRSEVIRMALTSGLKDTRAMGRQLRNPLIKSLVRALLALDGEPDQLALFERAVQESGAFPDQPPDSLPA